MAMKLAADYVIYFHAPVFPLWYIYFLYVFDGILISSLGPSWSHLFHSKKPRSAKAPLETGMPAQILASKRFVEEVQQEHLPAMCQRRRISLPVWHLPKRKRLDGLVTKSRCWKMHSWKMWTMGPKTRFLFQWSHMKILPWMVDLGISLVFCRWRDRCRLLLKNQCGIEWTRASRTCFLPIYR